MPKHNNSQICITAIILLVLLGGFLAWRTIFQQPETFASYQQEIKDLARSKDIAKDKYPFENVSQESVAQQQQDYAQTLVEPTMLANTYKASYPDGQNLLPVDQASDDWSKANPQGAGSLELQNMLSAGQHIGVDTQGSSLKNANQQLRSEPPNPIIPISVFNNSTIVPDIYRKELEIGES